MNACYYLLEANAYLLAFYALYKLALQNETFYTFNRWYLLGTSLVSFVMPAISLSGLRPVTETVYTTYAVAEEAPVWTMADGIILLYVVCSAAFLMRLAVKLYGIYRLVKNGKATSKEGVNIVWIKDKNLSFSFLNYLFIHPEAPKADLIIRHERVHIRQLHSADVLWFELLQILNWFNPFIHYMRKDIKALHEFIADEVASGYEQSTGDYALFLIRYSYGAAPKELGNAMFNKSLLKSRIMKLNQKKSPGIARIKYALALLLLPVMVCTTALAFTKSYGLIDLMPAGNLMVQDTLKKKVALPPPPPQASAAKTIPPPPPPEPPRAKKLSAAKPPKPAVNPKTFKLPPIVKENNTNATKPPKPRVYKLPPPVIKENKTNTPKPPKPRMYRYSPPVIKEKNTSESKPSKPTVTITSPAASSKTTNSLVTIESGPVRELETQTIHGAATGGQNAGKSSSQTIAAEAYNEIEKKLDIRLNKPSGTNESEPDKVLNIRTGKQQQAQKTLSLQTTAPDKVINIKTFKQKAVDKPLPEVHIAPAVESKPNKVLNINTTSPKDMRKDKMIVKPTGLVKEWINRD